LDIDYDITYC